jgi:hypothetical protein
MHPTGMNRLTQWILHEAWIVALELVLVAALAISLAHWTWVAVSPVVVAAPSSSAGTDAARPEQIASQNLFGAASPGAATVRAAQAPESRCLEYFLEDGRARAAPFSSGRAAGRRLLLRESRSQRASCCVKCTRTT